MPSSFRYYPENRNRQRVKVTAKPVLPLENQMRHHYELCGDTPPWRADRASGRWPEGLVGFPAGIVQGEMPPSLSSVPTASPSFVNSRIHRNVLLVARLLGAAELRLQNGRWSRRFGLCVSGRRRHERAIGGDSARHPSRDAASTRTATRGAAFARVIGLATMTTFRSAPCSSSRSQHVVDQASPQILSHRDPPVADELAQLPRDYTGLQQRPGLTTAPGRSWSGDCPCPARRATSGAAEHRRRRPTRSRRAAASSRKWSNAAGRLFAQRGVAIAGALHQPDVQPRQSDRPTSATIRPQRTTGCRS